ncbi:unnamed protein product [Prorocentrum cordatum]|uniref:Uncharacterized protein n=1 Tax=Prorocentrum cordatum TaxID=2364126 RepID=A0ABN9TCV3_9DINO|nr:unnamed protein product [Polarella glacialis]
MPLLPEPARPAELGPRGLGRAATHSASLPDLRGPPPPGGGKIGRRRALPTGLFDVEAGAREGRGPQAPARGWRAALQACESSALAADLGGAAPASRLWSGRPSGPSSLAAAPWTTKVTKGGDASLLPAIAPSGSVAWSVRMAKETTRLAQAWTGVF